MASTATSYRAGFSIREFASIVGVSRALLYSLPVVTDRPPCHVPAESRNPDRATARVSRATTETSFPKARSS